MKSRKNNWIELGMLGFLGLLVVLSLVIPQLFRDQRPPQLLSISVLLRDTDSSGWTAARQGMEQAADEMGAELRFLSLSGQDAAREQEELCLREIDGGAEALVVVPAAPEELYGALLQRQGSCPIVTLESFMGGSAGTVAPDNTALGRRLAQTLLEDWDEGEVLLLNTAPQCTGLTVRLDAARETLEEAGVPVRLEEELPRDAAGVRWVMAFDSAATQQAAERREAEELSLALYGVGASTAVTSQLEQGNIAAVAAWSDYAAGYLAVRQAVEAVQGEDGALSPLAFSMIRREDIYEPENQKLLFPIMSSSGR